MADLPEPGTRVSIETTAQTFTGRLLPQESEAIVLKLDSGYNIGISPKNIISLTVITPVEFSQTTDAPTIEQNATLPKIALLHTGGTIASRVDYKTGAVVADFDPASLLELFPELTSIAQIESTFLGNMFSDDFRFAHFNKIATVVHQAVKSGMRNIIVTSGTDFLHYLSAGLSFLFKDYAVGILVVGSQRSSDRGSSDAGMNLLCAAQFLTTANFIGVGICMHASSSDDVCVILPGVNARKMHSSRRDAFESINTTPLALVDYMSKEVRLLRELPTRKIESLPKKAPQLNANLKIGLLYSHPNMYAQELTAYNSFDGLVVAGSGLGHLPCTAFDDATKEHKLIREQLAILSSRLPVVMSVQTFHGKVNLNVYSQGRLIQEAGVLGNFSAMIPETTYMKLAYLLSQNISKEDISTQLMDNWVGEHDVESFDAFKDD